MDDVRIPPGSSGDGLYAAGERRRKRLLESDRRYAAYMGSVREEEARLGRPMTPSERDRHARDFHAEEYRAVLRRLARSATRDEGLEDL